MPHQLINSLLPYPMVRNETSNVAVLLQGPQKAQLQSFGGLGKAQQGPGEHLNGLQLLGHRGHHGDHGSIEHCGLDSFVYNIDNIYYILYIYIYIIYIYIYIIYILYWIQLESPTYSRMCISGKHKVSLHHHNLLAMKAPKTSAFLISVQHALKSSVEDLLNNESILLYAKHIQAS